VYQKKVGADFPGSHTNLEGLTMVDEKLLKNDHILEEMVQRLVTAFHPDYIYLYGSRARGERPGRTVITT
jgi:hypothetical protein